MRVCFIQNIDREKPGLLVDILDERNIDYEIFDLSQKPVFPDIGQYDAFVVLGGPPSANDTDNWMPEEVVWIKKIIESGKPYLGICLGMQALAKAAGAEVVRYNRKEIGIRTPEGIDYQVTLNNVGMQDPLFADIISPFKVFQLHGETVVPNDRVVVLGEGNDCPVQVIKVDKAAYGVQPHVELTRMMFHSWCENDPDIISYPQGDSLEKEYRRVADQYEKTCKVLFSNFLGLAKG